MLKAYPKVNVTEYLTLWICTDGILSRWAKFSRINIFQTY